MPRGIPSPSTERLVQKALTTARRVTPYLSAEERLDRAEGDWSALKNPNEVLTEMHHFLSSDSPFDDMDIEIDLETPGDGFSAFQATTPINVLPKKTRAPNGSSARRGDTRLVNEDLEALADSLEFSYLRRRLAQLSSRDRRRMIHRGKGHQLPH